jgi:hypothetical protein
MDINQMGMGKKIKEIRINGVRASNKLCVDNLYVTFERRRIIVKP